jgi:hypothetical protein
MLSIGLRPWYINITITILDFIHRAVFYLNNDVSETGFCIRLHVKPTHVGSIDIASICLRIVLNPKKEPRNLGGPHSRSGLHGGEKNLLLLPVTEKTIWSPPLHRWNTALGGFSQDGGKTRLRRRVEGGGGWYRPARAGVPGEIVAWVTCPPRGVCQDPPPTPRKRKETPSVGADSHVRGRYHLLKQQQQILVLVFPWSTQLTLNWEPSQLGRSVRVDLQVMWRVMHTAIKCSECEFLLYWQDRAVSWTSRRPRCIGVSRVLRVTSYRVPLLTCAKGNFVLVLN